MQDGDGACRFTADQSIGILTRLLADSLGGTDDVLARFTASLNAATQVSEFRL